MDKKQEFYDKLAGKDSQKLRDLAKEREKTGTALGSAHAAHWDVCNEVKDLLARYYPKNRLKIKGEIEWWTDRKFDKYANEIAEKEKTPNKK